MLFTMLPIMVLFDPPLSCSGLLKGAVPRSKRTVSPSTCVMLSLTFVHYLASQSTLHRVPRLKATHSTIWTKFLLKKT